jgi:dinuclear metal center YbgI/SA1388 family protein
MTVSDILRALSEFAPPEYKMDFDNVGLLVGDPRAEVGKVMLSLDITSDVVREAAQAGAGLIVSHHPVMFETKSVRKGDPFTGKIYDLISNGISAICMHTNLDSAAGGVNDALAAAVGLTGTGPLDLAGEDGNGFHGIGRVGTLPKALSMREFLPRLKASLKTNGLRYYDAGRPVSRVAVGGGSCGGYLGLADELGCDTFITADVKYDVFLEARERGVKLIDGDHFCTENVVIEPLRKLIASRFPGLDVTVSNGHHQTAEFYV